MISEKESSINDFIIALPVVGFLIEWIAIFVLLDYEIYSYYPVKAYTYFVVVSGVLSVLLGYLIVQSNYREPAIVGKSYFSMQDSISVLEKMLFVTFLLNIIGFLIIYREVSIHFNSYFYYFENPIQIRMFINNIVGDPTYKVSLLFKMGSYFTNLGPCTSFLAGVMFVSSRRYRIVSGVILFFLFFLSLLSFSRYFFITIVGFFVISASITMALKPGNPQNKLKKIGLILSVFLITIAFVFFLIFRARTFNVDKFEDLLYSQIYFYFVGGVPSLNNFLIKDPTFIWGESTFRSIIKWMERFNLIDPLMVKSNNHEFARISPKFVGNTYTFVKSFYHDFGIPGVILFSISWGGAYAYVSKIIKIDTSFLKLFILIILGFGLIMSFFNLYFEGLTLMLLWFGYLLVVFTSIKKFLTK